ncbi:DUF2269 family protein [Sorangium sp. So ce385]|uniref:DUF2269 family protein n=1 Tax=Sorangium sp. So ce385 TaxID=3133308 RepID=UPI003F5C23C7
MRSTLKLVHFIGLSAFLGSIAVYIVVSSVCLPGDLAALATGRALIRTGTLFITVPGLWALLVSGAALAARLPAAPRWLKLKLGLVALIALNTHLAIVPATGRALDLAQASVRAQALDPAYRAAYLTESGCGAVNVLLFLAVIALSVFRPSLSLAKGNLPAMDAR